MDHDWLQAPRDQSGMARRKPLKEEYQLFGVISSIKSTPYKRKELFEILDGSSQDLAGCLSYVIAEDLIDQDTLWVTEIWDKEQSHRAALLSETVRAGIARARPIIAGVQQVARTNLLTGTIPCKAS